MVCGVCVQCVKSVNVLFIKGLFIVIFINSSLVEFRF